MKLKKHITVFLVIIMIFSALPITSSADDSARETVDANIMTVYGGADGIISMTFDDGYYNTCVILNELLAKYDLKASIMVIASRTNNAEGGYISEASGREIFSAGYLEPQSHSMTHTRLENVSYDVYEEEIKDSRALIEKMFPGNDVITFAIPYGTMDASAYEYASDHYYAIRTTESNGIQTIDPGFSNELGSWSKMYSPASGRLKYYYGENYTDEQQLSMLISDINRHADGWYAPITHRVGDRSDPNVEMSANVAEEMFAYIAKLRDEGKVWVTTYSEAVKYVRERQNSTVNAYSENGEIFVEVKMSDSTADGLALDPAVFDTPLTVKVEVPSTYGVVYYTTGSKQYITGAFKEGARSYIYANIVPNDGPVKIRVSSTHNYDDEWEDYDDDYHVRYCTDCRLPDYATHEWNEGEIIDAPTHTATGTKECACIHCGKEDIFITEKTPEHTFDQEIKKTKFKASDATCTEGKKYYYSCECGAKGAETFYSSAPLGHEGEWKLVSEPTATEGGVEKRVCTRCGEDEERSIAATGVPDNEDDAPSVPSEEEKDNSDNTVIIAIAVVGVVVVGGAIVTVVLIRKKKSGK